MKHAALIALALVACKDHKRHEPPKPTNTDVVTGSDDGNVVQPRFSNGQAAPSDDGTLGFTITKVHTQQQPADAAPFHAAGGDWTYFEAHVDGDPDARFVVGLPAQTTSADGPGFGKLILAPTSRDAGAHVIAALAKTLRVPVPPATAGGVLQPMKVPTATLGHNIGKLDNGYGGKGTWDANKLFCSAGEIEAAELFFNVSVADKRGVFSEKDTDYNADVVACLAIALRDGLPPPRTKANDPTLADKPITLVRGKQISKHRAEEVSLKAARVLVAEERGDSAALLEVDLRSAATKELYKTPDRIEWGRCDETATRCLLKISKPTEARNVFGGKDRPRLAIFEGGKVTPLDIPDLELPSLPAAPFSPDGKYVVAETPDELVALDRKTKKVQKLAKGDFLSIDVVSWAKDGDKWVAIVTKLKDTEDEPPVVVEWNVDTGAVKPSKRPAPPERSPVSPDGKRRADFKDGKVVVTVDGKPKPTLALHPVDARNAEPGCCYWVDNRVVVMYDGYLDTDTMKVSPSVEDEDEHVRVAFIPGTRMALMISSDGTWLANLVVP